MKAVFAAAAATALLALGAGPAVAGNHSGPEADAKGTGSLTATDVSSAPIMGCTAEFFGFCISVGPVGEIRTTTHTSEDFDFDAKAGPQTLTPIDPTDGPYGHMHLTYQQSASRDTIVYGNCINGVAGAPTCPTPSHTDLPSQDADVTADVTCLQVVNNTAAIGGHVTKFEGDFTPTRGLLFNGVDNTVAGQQPTADLFDAAFMTDAPQVCPAPSGGHPITSGDVYVDQS